MALLKVQTEGGLVEGLPANNQVISVFKGIPFAKPPVGDLRWRAPEPVEPWEGNYEAFRFRNICTQPRFASEGGNTLAATEFYVVEFPMSEDCLYLNVWTPAESDTEKLPVAVYIHGGGYETGFSYLNAYDGEGFAKRGVVFVSIAYRLNFFGFLAHPELAAEDPNGSTGNYGEMDQIAALEWVKRNIGAFGGDPETVTIFGQSAGASSVQNICASPLSEGLFKRAIMQSGGGLSRNGVLEPLDQDTAYAMAEDFMEFAGYKNIEEARKAADLEMLEKYQAFTKARGLVMPVFAPSVDGYVLPDKAYKAFRAGKHPDIDYMVGSTADEMRNKNAVAPPFENIKKAAEQRYGELAEAYLTAIDASDPEKCRPYFEDFFADETLAGCLGWCENQLLLGRRPSYMYHFSYVPPGAEEVGAHHSVEHHYVFQTLVRSFRPYTGFDFDLSEELAGYWANFVKTGNPNGEGPETWSSYTKDSPKALLIDRKREMVKMQPSRKVCFMRDFSLVKF